MGLDNGTYIVKLLSEQGEEVFFVGVSHAIENIFVNFEYLRGFCSAGECCESLELAKAKAAGMEWERTTAYGVWVIDQFEDYTLRQITKMETEGVDVRTLFSSKLPRSRDHRQAA
jgi:hypothetical protein